MQSGLTRALTPEEVAAAFANAPDTNIRSAFGEASLAKWQDEEGKTHRDGDLPAMVYSSGMCVWYQHGEEHREGDLRPKAQAFGLFYRMVRRTKGLAMARQITSQLRS